MTFVENPKEENELPLDKNLKQKLEEWKQDFMLLLIEYCRNYIKHGLKFPKSVEKPKIQSDADFDKVVKSGSALIYDNKPDSKILGLSSIEFARDYPLPSSDVVGIDNPTISGCYQAHEISNGNLAMSKDLEIRSRAEAACTSKVYEEGTAVDKDIGSSFGLLTNETKDVVAKLRASLREVLEHVTLGQVLRGELPKAVTRFTDDPDAWITRVI